MGALQLPGILALGAALLVVPGTARADDERTASVGLGWAWFSTLGEPAEEGQEPPALSPDAGGSLTLAHERMIGTDLGLRGSTTFGAFYGGNQEMQSKASYAVLADVGVVFKLDVMRFVPYGFASVGGVASWGGPIDNGIDLVVVLGGGVDWLTSRKKSIGFEARVASFGGDVTVLTAGIRGTVHWGLF
jgi:hypothetical protein